ncbi:MAG: hypothetical protein EA397_16920 [Deltaproteobacteria bacterium]|nr:MAG: hypothetical protein EA397_16920 [Deltaproteobacteria bacterium]
MSGSPANERWLRLAQEHEPSGLSIRELARRHDFNPSTSFSWKSRLRRMGLLSSISFFALESSSCR